MLEFFGQKYFQGNQEYISAIIPMGFILNHYEVLIYKKDLYGYQRAPKKMHYNKITKEILENINNQVTPTSIILGINSDDIGKMFKIENIDEKIIKLEHNNESNINFRVIDGQHRIKGFEKARKDASDDKIIEAIDSYSVNVIIMLSDPKRRKPEVKVFSNINSKAKPIKMDLPILAEHLYDLIEETNDINVISYLAVLVIEHLNNGKYCEYWLNGILMDAYNDDVRVGCVGFKPFFESIEPICKQYCDENKELKNVEEYQKKKVILEKLAEEIAEEIFGNGWNYVFNKWKVVSLNKVFDGEEFVKTYYNKEYYLQRTMGAYAINDLIVKSYLENKNLDDFINWIDSSDLIAEDWSIGGKFSGMSSQSGIYKIKKIITGDI